MAIEEDLRIYLLAATTIQTQVGDRVHYNHVPQQSDLPYVWFRRSALNEDVEFDGPGGLKRTSFDLECYGENEDEAQDLGTDVRARLHGAKGTVGDSTSLGIFVSDQDDDYIPRGDASDEGLNQISFSIEVWH